KAVEFTPFEPMCAVFRRHLRGLGHKYTPERAQILDTLVLMDDLFQVEELIDALKDAGHRVSKATVYRTIKLLQEAGIIQQVLFDAEHAHYQLAYGRKTRDIIVCVDTNEIVSVVIPELDEIAERVCAAHGLTPESHRLQIFAKRN
ncbi:MAG: transcriptional repressor, partial [Phycisphaerales bacterium]|nr:transcriptional repressor [Phycisphaerales bacterium]